MIKKKTTRKSIFAEFGGSLLLLAVLGSIAINIGIAITGILPSYFITGANLLYFGFWGGFFVSFLGESIGAVVAFVLYRKGFSRYFREKIKKYPRWEQLLQSQGREAFFLIIYLRMLPFIPSGIVTFGGSIGRVSLTTFAWASSLGKIPALFVEALTAYQVTQFTFAGKIILFIVGIFGVFQLVRRKFSNK